MGVESELRRYSHLTSEINCRKDRPSVPNDPDSSVIRHIRKALTRICGNAVAQRLYLLIGYEFTVGKTSDEIFVIRQYSSLSRNRSIT